MMKGELKFTSRLLDTVPMNSIDEINDKMMPENPERQKDIFEDIDGDQMLSEQDESILRTELSKFETLKKLKPATRRPRKSEVVTSSNKILRHHDFEIVNHYKWNGCEPTKTLVVKDTKKNLNEETQCYAYHYYTRTNSFVCNGCIKLGKNVSAKFQLQGDEKIIELSKRDHICKSISYEKVMEKRNPVYIEKPYFEIRYDGTTENLITFTNDDYSIGNEYYYDVVKNTFLCKACTKQHNIYVSAKLIEKNGENFVRLNRPHVCQPKDVKEIIVKEPDFVMLKKNQVFIFSSKELNMGYKYFYNSKIRCYLCCDCHENNRHVSAKSFLEENNNQCFKLSKNEHICKPIKYQCDISEIKQPDLIWPKAHEGNTEYEHFLTKMRLVHPHGICPLIATTYVITSAPPGSTVERKASSILYVGYSDDPKKRFEQHLHNKGIVRDLEKQYGGVGGGFLNFQLQNQRPGSWKSNDEPGGFRSIIKNPYDPPHNNLVLAFAKAIMNGTANNEMIWSSDVKRKPRS
uniref:GIY-YIG domain-containing protein n=1 Tax=Panagrolaimus sp. ES5 TaxID=591445 RepID=A0AC34GQG6_9BILA